MITDFNTPNHSVIIGLDHGYGNMKTAHACFQTGVMKHEKEPTFKSGLLRYEENYYTIGEDHKEFTADKMNDPDYFILTLAGIASELAFYGRQSADVHLAVGLPLTWVAEQKDDFKKYLMQRDPREEIAFAFKGKEYRLIGTARHSETLEELVVYRALYGEGDVWARPADMWNETVETPNGAKKRFERTDKAPG